MIQEFEIYVKVEKGQIACFLNEPYHGFVKAKVTVEKPEKKVTISESEFNEMLKKAETSHLYKWWPDHVKILKQKLFGESA